MTIRRRWAKSNKQKWWRPRTSPQSKALSAELRLRERKTRDWNVRNGTWDFDKKESTLEWLN